MAALRETNRRTYQLRQTVAVLRDTNHPPLCELNRAALCDAKHPPLCEANHERLLDANRAPLCDANRAPIIGTFYGLTEWQPIWHACGRSFYVLSQRRVPISSACAFAAIRVPISVSANKRAFRLQTISAALLSRFPALPGLIPWQTSVIAAQVAHSARGVEP